MSPVIEKPDTRTPSRKKKGKKRHLPGKSQIFPTTLHSYTPKTALGRKLWELRQQIIASGTPLLDWDELEDELAERKGERGRDNDETDIH